MPEHAPSTRTRPAASATSGEISLVYAVGRVNHGVKREMRERLAAWGISVPQVTVLSVLARRPGLSNAQLARRAMVTPQAMIEILAVLESRGLVTRAAEPSHARILRASLSPAGASLLSEIEPVVSAIEQEMLAGLTSEERARVLEGLLKTMDRLRPRSASGPARGAG